MIDASASLALWLSAGVYAPVVADGPVEPLFQTAPNGSFNGLRLQMNSAQWDEQKPASLTSDVAVDARLYADDRGVLQLDQLRVESGLASVRSRPLLGDGLDLALLGGSWDTTWSFIEVDEVQIQLYSPTTVTLLGLSNTDFDADRRLKHYLAAGIGPGVRVTGALVGPVAVFAHAEGLARSMNRHQAGDLANQVRHEVSAEGSLGLGWTRGRAATMLGAWAEVVSQWETRDRQGHDGVDRQVASFGVELTVLTQRDAPDPLDEELEQLKLDGSGLTL
jgi:hypothetical protein